ncbi:MAG TPA: hypothetical protein VMU87_03115 [Stellaceae bacterium]|nr:hypothetical protein [Stellaceae bacterium]
MMCYVVYDPATGAILKSGHCGQPADMPRQAKAGQAVMAVSEICRGDKQRIDITKTPPAVVAIAAPAAVSQPS